MGHQIKTANRGEAIIRNSSRISALAKKMEDLANLVAKAYKESEEKIDAVIEGTDELEVGFAEQIKAIKEEIDIVNGRLDLLERSVWRKIMDKVKKKEPTPPTPNHRAVMLDIHSVKHTLKSETKEKKEEKEDGDSQPRND